MAIEPIPSEVLRLYMGGAGYGARLLYDELPAGIDPLSPENLMIIATGPLSLNRIPGGGSVMLCFKSPLTGIWGESRVGSDFGPDLKKAGFDFVIIKGRVSAAGVPGDPGWPDRVPGRVAFVGKDRVGEVGSDSRRDRREAGQCDVYWPGGRAPGQDRCRDVGRPRRRALRSRRRVGVEELDRRGRHRQRRRSSPPTPSDSRSS